MAGEQDAVFALLADPATHGGAAVKRLDTHAASVFLAGDHAFKVKRAVTFPFLDFSTLDKRQAALAAEIEANKPFAPELYLGLVPITRDGDRLRLGGDGPAVEWALKMRRFDETRTLDHLADAGRIDAAMALALAHAVAAAHARAPVVAAEPWIAAIGDYIAQNERAFRGDPDLFATAAVDDLTRASRAAYDRVLPLLRHRGAMGLVRRGHGDLHLGNIAAIDGRPVPFDALEFNPVVASGDVLYDLGFLLMDLVGRKLKGAANIVLNGYLTETRRDDDLDGLAALPLFMSLRAAIRAKVTAAKLPDADPAGRAGIAHDARNYFALACSLIAPPRARLIAVGGLSGTGKSLLARSLAPDIPPAPGAVVLRSDIERKAQFNVAETERLPEQGYTPEATARVYAALGEKACRIVAAGHSAIVDAVFARPTERAAILDAARARHVKVEPLFLIADLATRMARAGARLRDASDADAAVALRQESYDLGDLDWTLIEADGTPDDTLARARAELS